MILCSFGLDLLFRKEINAKEKTFDRKINEKMREEKLFEIFDA